MNDFNFNKILTIAVAFCISACDPAANSYNKGKQTQQSSVSAESPQMQITSDLLKEEIRLYESNLPVYLASVRGLAAPESFGRWSIAKIVIFDFKGALPEQFDLQIVLGGFGSNVGADLQVIVGSEVKQLKIKSDIMHMQTYMLNFSNTEKVSSIALIIPFPSSPQALGIAANDPRMLGVALQSMLIKPILKLPPIGK